MSPDARPSLRTIVRLANQSGMRAGPWVNDEGVNMADPMRIRAQAAGDKATVRVLMSHEMETGQRKDSAGKPVPAWFIQEVSASHNGKAVLSAQWGPAVSKNPFLQFTVKGAKAGDKIAVSWVDNKGDKRTDEAIVS